MSTVGTEARTAARWWADKLRDDFTPDNGDPEQPLVVTALFGVAHAAERENLTAAKIDAFERSLAIRVQGLLDEDISSYGSAMELSTDYAPGPTLRAALEDAGIQPQMMTLPWKTTMWVQPGFVRVGDDYCAAPVDLPLMDVAS